MLKILVTIMFVGAMATLTFAASNAPVPTEITAVLQ